MQFSYHNHTNWSDGGATLAAMVQGARSAGLNEFGISDHFVVHPQGEQDWSIDTSLVGDYYATLRGAAAESPGLKLLAGLEVDYLPETAGRLTELLSPYEWDYLIGSVHFVGSFCVDFDAAAWRQLDSAEHDRIWRRYWELVAELAGSKLFDILAHPDLPKKFGFRPSVDLTELEDRALDRLAAAGMAIEINTAGWSLPAAEAYPAPSFLQRARTRDIPLTISADAHFPEHVARDFPRAYALARDTGYTELVRFDRRQMHRVPLN